MKGTFVQIVEWIEFDIEQKPIEQYGYIMDIILRNKKMKTLTKINSRDLHQMLLFTEISEKEWLNWLTKI